MKKITFIIISINLFILAAYLTSMDIYINGLRMLIIALLLFCILSMITARYFTKFFNFIQQAHLSLFSVLILFCCIESLKYFPEIIPAQVRIYLSQGNINKERHSVLDYLNQSPFIKFKPNTVVTSQGYRGSKTQFAYKWKTDALGFKNPDDMLKDGGIKAVAIGDSFTEGMGVATDDTYASLLTKHGYITYNLGVQGYAPSQLEGCFRIYGKPLKPRYVIIGYVSNTYEREKTFNDQRSDIKKTKFTGAIESSVRSEMRKQTKHVTTALYLLLNNYYQQWQNVSKQKHKRKYNNNLFKLYESEFMDIDSSKIDENKIKTSPEFISALRAFKNIKTMCDDIGALPILIYFPRRGHVYYEKATGKPFPMDGFEAAEIRILKSFCVDEGITFLNPLESMIKYVNSLNNNTPLTSYPYLEIDGHLSPAGHEIVMKTILDHLKYYEGSHKQ